MGRNYQPDPAAGSSIYSAITAGEDIKAGDLITQTANGRAYWANDPSNVFAQMRPVYQPADVSMQTYGATVIPVIESVSGTFDSDGPGALLLDDGAFVVGWIASGTSPRDVWFSIYNKDLTVRVAKVRVANNAGSNGSGPATVMLHKLPNGNFMLVFRGTGNGPAFAIYATDGSLVKAATSIEVTSGFAWSSALLTNGSVAVAYTSGSGAPVKYAVVSQVGDLVQVATQIGTYSGDTAMAVAIAATADGGFAIAWNSGKLQKFTATGAAVGAAVNVYGGGAATNGYMHVFCVALPGGGIAVVSDVYAACWVYSSNLVLQNTYAISGMYATTNYMNCYCTVAAAADGGIFLAWVVSGSSSQQVGYAKLSATGVLLNSGVTPSTVNVGGGNGQMYRAKPSPDGGCFILTVNQIVQFDSNMNFVSIQTAPVNQPHMGGSLQAFWMVDTSNPLLYNVLILAGGGVGGAYPVYVKSCTFFAPARWPIGVALSDAVKGGQVTFVAVGPARTRIMFTRPAVFDATATPAQKLSIIGNLAIMKGFQ